MTTREIAAASKERYDADVSPALVSKVTDAVMEQLVEWQNRPLDAVCPIAYLDCIVLKVRQDNGPELVSLTLALWAEEHGVILEFIKPGKPTQNAFIDCFNGRTEQKYWIFICTGHLMKQGKSRSAGGMNITTNVPMNPRVI